jgi:hypothetical protein
VNAPLRAQASWCAYSACGAGRKGAQFFKSVFKTPFKLRRHSDLALVEFLINLWDTFKTAIKLVLEDVRRRALGAARDALAARACAGDAGDEDGDFELSINVVDSTGTAVQRSATLSTKVMALLRHMNDAQLAAQFDPLARDADAEITTPCVVDVPEARNLVNPASAHGVVATRVAAALAVVAVDQFAVGLASGVDPLRDHARARLHGERG